MLEIPTFVKWAGGKRRLIKDLELLFPQKIDRYFEPFLGGGSVFFYIKQKYDPSYVMISDKNSDLINSFQVVKNNPEKLINELRLHKRNHSVDYYYKIRALNPKKLNKIKRAARFIYLNKTCFNGLHRVNSKGEFNVPVGKYTNPEIFDQENILFANSLLQKVKIKQQSFEKVVDFANKRDFVYFDPCYNPKNRSTIFNSYTEDGFFKKEQESLAMVFRKLDKRGCKLMLSNSSTALVRKLYEGYRIKTVRCARSINSKGDGRGKVKELVILNYGPTKNSKKSNPGSRAVCGGSLRGKNLARS